MNERRTNPSERTLSHSQERTTNGLIRTSDVTLARKNDERTHPNDRCRPRMNERRTNSSERTMSPSQERTTTELIRRKKERTNYKKNQKYRQKNKKSCWQLVWEEKKVNKRKGKNQTCCRSLMWAFCCALFSFPFSTSDLSLLIMSKRFSCFSCITCLL